jgi:beta-galactosidase
MRRSRSSLNPKRPIHPRHASTGTARQDEDDIVVKAHPKRPIWRGFLDSAGQVVAGGASLRRISPASGSPRNEPNSYVSLLTSCLILFTSAPSHQTSIGSFEAALPAGVHAEWSAAKAWRETTPTREKICLNGLWRWQPATSTEEVAPTSGWGWFKVPGPWPGITDYMEKDCQTVIENPGWKGVDLSRVTGAWYEREFETPVSWAGRRVRIEAAYVNSLALVQVDGKKAGVINFPAGSVDIASRGRPGKHRLSILVLALPLKAALLSYADTNHAKTMQATVPRRGLCGDVFIEAEPNAESIDDIRIQTSFRKRTLTVWQELRNLDPARRYISKAEILDHGRLVKTLTSGPFQRAGERFVSWNWMPAKLWDLDTPENQFELRLSLLTANGKLLDTLPPRRFGFREFWIDGKDFYLNGTRIFWSLVPLENAGVSAGVCSYDAAKETMTRLKQIGINMVYTHNYDCEPGSFLSFDELLRAADDVGMLVAVTQPHFSDYDWEAPAPTRTTAMSAMPSSSSRWREATRASSHTRPVTTPPATARTRTRT